MVEDPTHLFGATRAFPGHVVPVRRPVTEEVADGDSLALYDPEGTRLVVLNAGASSIWQLFDGSRTLQDVVDALSGGYDASPHELRHDVWSTYERFLSLGLVEIPAPSGSTAPPCRAADDTPTDWPPPAELG